MKDSLTVKFGRFAMTQHNRLSSSSSQLTGPPNVDVGLIFTHETQYMPRLLSTLVESGRDSRARLILVDNASQDGVADWLGYFEPTRVIRNNRRLGYAANLNRILDASSAPFILLLNTDMYFDPEAQCISRMVTFMNRHADCGVAGCRLYHEDGGYAFPARRFHSLKTILARRFDVGSVMSNEIKHHLYHDRSSLDTYDCDWLSGCLLMVRRAAFEQVGGFDTRFEKYFEDVDFCLRMAAAGWRVMFNGETYGYHLEQRASRHLFTLNAWQHMRSYLRWIRKWGRDPYRWIRETAGNSQRAA